ncbi:MAG: dephospho-CoA kinase [Tannerella sp.]|jgi:dephospho-CoA kinase|nr:dephospho-CoA kinase [Tannerella sp.]
MIKAGVTGGIGSGKSVVSRLLEMSGVPVYRADDESKRLTETSPAIRSGLQALFGNEIYTDKGLDRKRLASSIFTDEHLLRKVNAIIHPVVTEDFNKWTKSCQSNVCAMESAIIYEAGLEKNFDLVLMVFAPVALRLTRAMQRDNASEAEIIRRMNRQMPDELKRSKADYLVINDDMQALMPQIEQFIIYLQNERRD